jgi:predicted amidohydrolase YtcJ
MNRRRFIATTAVAAASVPVAPTSSAQPPQEETLVLTNGRFHTMDARSTVAGSVAIRNGRFIAVGGKMPKGKGVTTINLRGRTVTPGLIEPHVHIVSLANRPGYHTILENTASIREIQDALSARRKEVPEGQWITSFGGWHPNQWTEHRHPTLAELDAAVPDRPVLLYERFTGPAVTNTPGKQYFDSVDAATTRGEKLHPDLGLIKTSPAGAIGAAGFGNGGPAASALFLLRRLQTMADKRRSHLDAMNYSVQLGLTAHLDQVLFPTPGPLHPTQILSNLDQYHMYDTWMDLHREGKAIVRLQMNFLHNQADPNLPELKERLRNSFQYFGDNMLQTGSIGEWAAPLGSGAAWQTAQRLVADAGWHNENAVQNLAGLRQVVEAWEAIAKDHDFTKQRYVVHHVPEVNADLLTRLQKLGAGVEMGAFRWVTSADAKVAGPPFRTILDHGIKAGIHGDGVHIAPLNPWSHIQYAVTGINSYGTQVNPGQHLTRQEALRLFTRENAWFLKMEDKIGSIETGKLADAVVLDRDYFAIPELEIHKTRAALTVVNGQIVHNTGVA